MQELLSHNEISVHLGDLPNSALALATGVEFVAWDTETSGLNWKTDRLGVCQIYIPDKLVFVIQMNGVETRPKNIARLLCDPKLTKVFHHAVFDLRFLINQWGLDVENVACTKIASKVLCPEQRNHSLKYLLQTHLGVHLAKQGRTSNWLGTRLSQKQLSYAARDVLYLPDLFQKLRQSLKHQNRWHLAQASFDYLPTRARLDILGAGDVYQYNDQRL